ncbi:nSTAND1 domain-containing NTPase [Knoellia sp. LjRoot47]|uniref:nSTAND1 domain-containing NTPase n=1 Tax=Knoellia sp. LjRoot47 TaxID=3342330 RepID=UPI003ECC9945
MGVGVLGPLEVDGRTDGLSPRDRVVLSALVVARGDPVRSDTLADALWGEHPPPTSVKVVQGCIVRLRKVLGPAAIDSGTSGYRLTLTSDEVDHSRFEHLLASGREALDGDDPARASYLVGEALDLWRGRALGDVEEWEPGRVEAARLEGLRMEAEEVLMAAELRAGHAEAVIERGRSMVSQAPFRERRWVLLATALHQAERQAEALAVVRRARTMLADEVGLDPGPELVELETRLLRQDPSLRPPVEHVVSATSPYPGLMSYGTDDADTFFGREDDCAACLRRLRDTGLLAVVGASGVGKSSLVLAGVVAALVGAGTPVMVTTPGSHPVRSLAGLKPRGRQTLVVDQAEEAVTLCTDPAERARYFGALAAHVGAGGWLVLCVRADHLGDFASHPDIARVLEDGLYLLGPMGEEELRSAVEGPARRAGLRLEPGLVDLLVQEVEGEPAALPLLSHVLLETWERREGATLTVAGYRATGGIRHAVARSAESLYDSMDDAQRSRLRGLLLRLVVPSEAGEAVRTRVPRTRVTVDEHHARLVEQLVGARLVSIDGDSVQIAHEALVRVWPRLRGWLDDDVDGQRLLRHLAGAADAWEAMDRPDSELLRGARLARTLEWRDRCDPELSDLESAYLASSAALSEAEQRAASEQLMRERGARRRLRGALAGVAVVTVLGLVAGAMAARSAGRAEAEAARALDAAALAEARRAETVALDHEDPSTSLLLSLAALQFDPSPGARENLGSVLMRWPSIVSLRPLDMSVVDVAASPDGDTIALSRPNGGPLLLDLASGATSPVDDETPTSGVAYSPDGRLLATAVNQWPGDDGGPPRLDALPIRLIVVTDGERAPQQLGGFPEGASVEYALDFSADGRRLVAAVDQLDPVTGGVLRTRATVWDLAAPSRPLVEVPVPEYPVLELSPDGRRLHVAVTGEGPGQPIRTYDVDSGRLVRSAPQSLGATDGSHVSGALSPDGKTFAVASGSSVHRVATETLEPIRPELRGDVGDPVERVEYSHDGSLVAGGTEGGTVLVWDARKGGDPVLRAPGGSAWGLAFGADDHSLLSVAGAGLVGWDLSGRRRLASVGTMSGAGGYDTSQTAPDGRTAVREQAGRTWFVNEATGSTTKPTPHPMSYHEWSPDSRWHLTMSAEAGLELWDPAQGRVAARSALPRGVDLIAVFGPSSDRVYVNVPAERRLHVLRAPSLEPVGAPIDLGEPSLGIAPHPSDGTVIALTRGGAVLRVDPTSGRVEKVAPDRTVAGRASVEVDVTPDGRRLLAPVGDEPRVQLVDTKTWRPVGVSARHDERLETFALSPDGTQFATLTGGRIELYDGRTGERQAALMLPAPSPSPRISYLPDGSGVVVTGRDGMTWTLETQPQSWVDRACAVAGRNLTRAEWQEHFPHSAYRTTCEQWPSGS